MTDSIKISDGGGNATLSDSSSDRATGVFEEEYPGGDKPETPAATDVDEGTSDLDSDSDSDDSSDDITVYGETHCVVRGIYYNTSFAKWWEGELARGGTQLEGPDYIEKTIAALHIMNNDVGYVLSLGERGPFPYMIWYPRPPLRQTLRFLAARGPQMSCQIIQACIHAGYKELYDELKERIEPKHLPYLLEEARRSGDLHYREDVERRGREGAVDVEEMSRRRDLDGDGSYILSRGHFEESTLTLPSWPAAPWVSRGMSWFSEPWGPYSGIGLDAAAVELYVPVPERMKWEVSGGLGWVHVDSMWEDVEKGRERMEGGGVAGEDAPGE